MKPVFLLISALTLLQSPHNTRSTYKQTKSLAPASPTRILPLNTLNQPDFQNEDDLIFDDTKPCSYYIDLFPNYSCVAQDPLDTYFSAILFHTSKQGYETIMKISRNTVSAAREIPILKLLGHCPNVAALVDYVKTSNLIIITYAFHLKGSLKQVMENESEDLDFDARLKIVMLLAKALICIHNQGYIYRDFNIANIILSRNYNPYFIDFQEAGKSPLQIHINFLHYYSSPEMVTAWDRNQYFDYSELSDVYGLGVILYYLIVGDYPVKHWSLNLPDILLCQIKFPWGQRTDFIGLIMNTIILEEKRTNAQGLYNLIQICLDNPNPLKTDQHYYYTFDHPFLVVDNHQRDGILYVVICVIIFVVFAAILISFALCYKNILKYCPCLRKATKKGRVDSTGYLPVD